MVRVAENMTGDFFSSPSGPFLASLVRRYARLDTPGTLPAIAISRTAAKIGGRKKCLPNFSR